MFGASGYTGFELVKLLHGHPEVAVRFVTSRSQAGQSLAHLYPAGPALPLIAPENAPLTDVDLVFLCLPHAAAAPTAVAALEAGARVVDLSADFRLKSAADYAHWYGVQHPAPDLLPEARLRTDRIRPRPTALRPAWSPTRAATPPASYWPFNRPSPLGPPRGPIIADAKSGVSGAGRVPRQNTHFVEVAGNFSPYKIGRAHRHLPEMEQAMAGWSKSGAAPHLLAPPAARTSGHTLDHLYASA